MFFNFTECVRFCSFFTNTSNSVLTILVILVYPILLAKAQIELLRILYCNSFEIISYFINVSGETKQLLSFTLVDYLFNKFHRYTKRPNFHESRIDF